MEGRRGDLARCCRRGRRLLAASPVACSELFTAARAVLPEVVPGEILPGVEVLVMKIGRGSFCEKTLAPRKQFAAKSFRWKQSGHAWILVGCPRGKWQPRKQHCTVGTRGYKLLVKKG